MEGWLLRLEMLDYVEMQSQGTLVEELKRFEQSLDFKKKLAQARNQLDPKPLLKQVNDMAVTIGKLNSPV